MTMGWMMTTITWKWKTWSEWLDFSLSYFSNVWLLDIQKETALEPLDDAEYVRL